MIGARAWVLTFISLMQNLSGEYMMEITDEYMKEMAQKTKPYTVMILHKTKRANDPGAERIIWEHGRRNHKLRREGILLIVCPVRDESDISGIGVFSTSVEETKKICDEDPGVKAGIFTYEIHASRSFPGDCLT